MSIYIVSRRIENEEAHLVQSSAGERRGRCRCAEATTQ